MEKTNNNDNTYKPKRRVLVPSWVWFWVHKLLFFLLTIQVFRNMHDDLAFQSWEFKYYGEEYGRHNYTSDMNNALSTLVRLEESLLHRVLAITLMTVVTILGVRAYRKENADIDLMNDIKKKGNKRTLLRFLKGFVDISLDIIMVIMALKSLNAVNYTFLSAELSDCTRAVKAKQLRTLENDMQNVDIVTERFEVGDFSLNIGDQIYYKPSDVSPYVWSFWLPGEADLIIWFDKDARIDSMSDLVMIDVAKEGERSIQLYSLKCGDMTFPMSYHDYSWLSRRLSENRDRTAYLEVSYYRTSHIIEDCRVITTNKVAFDIAQPIIRPITDLIAEGDYESAADLAGLKNDMSAQKLKDTVEEYMAEHNLTCISNSIYSNDDPFRAIDVYDDGTGFLMYYYLDKRTTEEINYTEKTEEHIYTYYDLMLQAEFLYTDDGGTEVYITDCYVNVHDYTHSKDR